MASLGWGSPQGVDLSFRATAVMATPYIAVKLSTTAGYVEPAGDGEQAVGILQSAAAAVGDAVQVRISGTSKVYANGAFSIGDLLNSADTTGYVDTKGATEHAIAYALEAATAQGDKVLAIIKHVYV